MWYEIEGRDNIYWIFKGAQALHVIGDITGNYRRKKNNADQPVVNNSQLYLQKRRNIAIKKTCHTKIVFLKWFIVYLS